MNSAEGWEKAEVLLHRSANGRLDTDRSTLDRLNSIQSPVHVVAVVGPYRKGKSHLLNIIIEALFGKTNVFPVGNTIQAQTKGVTIWCSPHPSIEGHWIIFLDTEGLNDVEQGDRDSDILIFVLSVLLSSTLVYNSCGVIDFRALETIHHVSVLANRIRLMSDLGEDLEDIGFDLAFPQLLWVVRDFQLNLEIDGTWITGDEYLEKALSTSNMVLGPKKATVIAVKRCIKEYFAERKCFLLPNLVKSENPSATEDSRQIDLINQVERTKCKMYEGSEVTGRVLGKLAEELVIECQRLDSKEPVDFQAIMKRIAEKENGTVIDRSLKLYRTNMTERTKEAVDEVTLHQIHLHCSETAATNFMQAAAYPVDSGFIRLMDAIKLEFEKVSEDNSAKITELCNQTFKALRKEIIGDSNTRYFCSGGFQKYREDMTKLRRRWEQNPVLHSIVGRNYFGNMISKLQDDEARLIMDADKSMTKMRKEDAVKRQQEERKRLEEQRKQKDVTAVSAVERDQTAFEDRVTSQVRSAILRPQEAEISKLNCRIAVLGRELDDLRARHAEDEAETCEQRLRIYQQLLSERQNEQPSKWRKVTSSIQSFARGTLESIRRLFKVPSGDTMPTPAAAAATEMSSPSVLAGSPVASRAPSHAPHVESRGSSLVPPAAATSAASGSSSTSHVASSAASPGSSSVSHVASSAASPVLASTSPGSSSVPSSQCSSSVTPGISPSTPVSSSTSSVSTSSISSLLDSSAAARVSPSSAAVAES